MNCLLYARVSTDKQAQKDLSIPAQIEAMRKYAMRNDWKLMGYLIDEGESVKNVKWIWQESLDSYAVFDKLSFNEGT